MRSVDGIDLTHFFSHCFGGQRRVAQRRAEGLALRQRAVQESIGEIHVSDGAVECFVRFETSSLPFSA